MGDLGVKVQHFPLTLLVVLTTVLSHYRVSVIKRFIFRPMDGDGYKGLTIPPRPFSVHRFAIAKQILR